MKRVLAASLAGASLWLAGCPNTADIDPMERQPKYKAYRTASFFPDRRAMRAPPADTIALEHDFGNPVEQMMPDGGVPVGNLTPEPVTEELVSLGQKKFNQACAVCHGYLANGESVVARKMSVRRPPSLLTDFYRNKTDAYIFNVITNGFGYMNPYRDMLSSHERWAVVSYIRALQLSQNAPVASLSPEEQQQVNAPPKAAGEAPEKKEGGHHE